MHKTLSIQLSIVLAVFILVASCGQNESGSSTLTWETVQDSTSRVQSISGFSGPEAVRYDPQQDVYFVSNFAGGGNDRDANGFISKVIPDGTLESLRFMTGSEAYPLHAPRGMYIVNGTLWVADIDGVHGFDTASGEQATFVDFTDFEPGFLNDIVQGADGNLYVTDTGESRIYRIEENTASVFVDSLPHSPNGITLDPASKLLVLAPWGGATTFHALDPSDASLSEFLQAESGGNFDGIEFVNNRLLAASQVDSSLHVIANGTNISLIKVPGRPADIGLDTRRNQVAVPYIDLNRVDIWQLPEK